MYSQRRRINTKIPAVLVSISYHRYSQRLKNFVRIERKTLRRKQVTHTQQRCIEAIEDDATTNFTFVCLHMLHQSTN